MKINTLRFGEIEISEEKILNFDHGLPPFDHCLRFTLINSEETEPFFWLQSVEEPDLALAVVNPFRLFPDYTPAVADEVLDALGNPPDEDILILTVAVITRDYQNMFANLVSPILVNPHNNRARQVIMDNSPYLTKTPIYDEVQAIVIGGTVDAGSHTEG